MFISKYLTSTVSRKFYIALSARQIIYYTYNDVHCPQKKCIG